MHDHANIVCALIIATRLDCACHRINTLIDTAWVELKRVNEDIADADKHARELGWYVHQAAGVQATLPMSLKGGGVTRPWRSPSKKVQIDICEPRNAAQEKKHYINRIGIDLVREVRDFLDPTNKVCDKLDAANFAALHHVLPSYYTFYRA